MHLLQAGQRAAPGHAHNGQRRNLQHRLHCAARGLEAGQALTAVAQAAVRVQGGGARHVGHGRDAVAIRGDAFK